MTVKEHDKHISFTKFKIKKTRKIRSYYNVPPFYQITGETPNFLTHQKFDMLMNSLYEMKSGHFIWNPVLQQLIVY